MARATVASDGGERRRRVNQVMTIVDDLPAAVRPRLHFAELDVCAGNIVPFFVRSIPPSREGAKRTRSPNEWVARSRQRRFLKRERCLRLVTVGIWMPSSFGSMRPTDTWSPRFVL